MRYPSPHSILAQLAQRGASSTRLQALKLLGDIERAGVFESWPRYERGSYSSLLRRLACSNKSAWIRLAAMRALITGISLEQCEQEWEQARRRCKPAREAK